MTRFSSPQTKSGRALQVALLVVLGLVIGADWQQAEAKHRKPPKDVPGLELPIFASMSAMGYAGYTYLKFRKRG
jgi:hypothetical protein